MVFGLELGLGGQKTASNSVICVCPVDGKNSEKLFLILIFVFNDF